MLNNATYAKRGKIRRGQLKENKDSISWVERVAIDILGPLPMTEKGNKYIVIISTILPDG